MKQALDSRLSEVGMRLASELEALEKRRTDLRNWIGTIRYIQHGTAEETAAAANGNGKRILSAAARRAISEAQKKRWARSRGATSKAPASGEKKVWTTKQDQAIVKVIKLQHAPIDAVRVSRLVAGKVKRSPGAVRQRIHRLAAKGILKQTGSGNGRQAQFVEVA